MQVFEPGQILSGRYRVISLLGKGGMGLVYKVEQIFLNQELALKTLDKSELTDVLLRRFQTEARAVFSVNHPNIIALHDFGLLDETTPFMVMELATGQTLADILRDRSLTLDEALSLFIQVCFGLAHAHENGVIHRDVKPSNIMLMNGMPWGTEGSVKILDFGIAKLVQHEEGEIQALTRTGQIFGSPLYMSPEQCLGEKVDHRSDIYSLGCVIFESLTRTPPFVSDNALSTMLMHQSSTNPSLKEASMGGEFPQALEDVLRKMLAKNPDDRYQNLGHTAHDLAALKRGDLKNGLAAINLHGSGPGSKTSAAAPNTITVGRNKFIAMLAGTFIVCACATAAVTVLAQGPDNSAASQR
ncbi:MAG TPA: serine/threonine-protein kinase [Drouetiella sp.]